MRAFRNMVLQLFGGVRAELHDVLLAELALVRQQLAREKNDIDQRTLEILAALREQKEILQRVAAVLVEDSARLLVELSQLTKAFEAEEEPRPQTSPIRRHLSWPEVRRKLEIADRKPAIVSPGPEADKTEKYWKGKPGA